MKILIIHSTYLLRGGEDAVFEQEKQLLMACNEVHVFQLQNKPGISGALQFIFSLWNFSVASKLESIIDIFKPDIIHFHNLHFAFGPVVIRTAKRLSIPTVYTLHNFRLLCPSGSLMKRGELFLDSLTCFFPWSAVRNRVFRNSHFQTFWLAFVVWFHKKINTWQLVDRYIVLTDFAKNLYLSSSFGISISHFSVKPNFAISPLPSSVVRSNHFLYIGRLSDEKGVNVLISAFQNSGCNLSIAGDGPLVDLVKNISHGSSTINYLGNLDKDGVRLAMQTCTALIFPSIWFEGMPMTIIEAFASGTPVIASNLGAMAAMIQHGVNGLHFEAGSVESLHVRLIQWMSFSEEDKAGFSKRASECYQALYTPEANYELLMNIYKSVIETAKPKLSATKIVLDSTF